jgi:hypothetical protein
MAMRMQPSSASAIMDKASLKKLWRRSSTRFIGLKMLEIENRAAAG